VSKEKEHFAVGHVSKHGFDSSQTFPLGDTFPQSLGSGDGGVGEGGAGGGVGPGVGGGVGGVGVGGGVGPGGVGGVGPGVGGEGAGAQSAIRLTEPDFGAS